MILICESYVAKLPVYAMFHLPTTTCPLLFILHVFDQCMYYVSSFRRVNVLSVHLLTIHERLLLVIVVFPPVILPCLFTCKHACSV